MTTIEEDACRLCREAFLALKDMPGTQLTQAKVDAAKRALDAALDEQWREVPMEPTCAMLREMMDEAESSYAFRMGAAMAWSIWRAALEVAPRRPT